MTAHVDTGEPLPRELFDKMLAAKNFQSGLATLRQIEFALFDMLLHTEHDPARRLHAAAATGARRGRRAAAAALSAARRTPSATSSPAATRRATTATSGPRCSAPTPMPRSRKQRVRTAMPSVETGRKYRQAILEAGGSRPAMESFKAFRGREPTLDALAAAPGHGLTQYRPKNRRRYQMVSVRLRRWSRDRGLLALRSWARAGCGTGVTASSGPTAR